MPNFVSQKRTVAELFNSTSAGGALEDNSSGANEWKVIDADLIVSTDTVVCRIASENFWY